MILFGRKVPLNQLIPVEVLEAYWYSNQTHVVHEPEPLDEDEDLFDLDLCYLIGICPECGFVMTGTYKNEEEEDRDLKSITMVHLEDVE